MDAKHTILQLSEENNKLKQQLENQEIINKHELEKLIAIKMKKLPKAREVIQKCNDKIKREALIQRRNMINAIMNLNLLDKYNEISTKLDWEHMPQAQKRGLNKKTFLSTHKRVLYDGKRFSYPVEANMINNWSGFVKQHGIKFIDSKQRGWRLLKYAFNIDDRSLKDLDFQAPEAFLQTVRSFLSTSKRKSLTGKWIGIVKSVSSIDTKIIRDKCIDLFEEDLELSVIEHNQKSYIQGEIING